MKKTSIVRFIEFCGKHPFATGLFALLSVIGFILSVYWQIENTHDSNVVQAKVEAVRTAQADGNEVVSEIDRNVIEVRNAVLADCAGPPCWSAREFLETGLIGKPQELLSRKLPPPSQKLYGQYYYSVGGCDVRISFRDDAVSYFAFNVGKDKDNACGSEWRQWFYGLDLPATNANLVMAPFLRRDAYINAACLDCGNFTDPFAEIYLPGSHAEGFIGVFLSTDLSSVSGGYGYYGTLRSRLTDGRSEAQGYDLDELHPEGFCGKEMAQFLKGTIPNAHVTWLGFGTSPPPPVGGISCK